MIFKPKGFYQLGEFYGILDLGKKSLSLLRGSKIILRRPGKVGNHEIFQPCRGV
jgi:hypothetical protein